MAGEYDLKLVAGDMAFGPDDEPLFLAGSDAVAQDVRHRLLESGLVAELVADEDSADAALVQIMAEVEEDERIRPGSAQAALEEPGTYRVSAETMDGAAVTQDVGA